MNENNQQMHPLFFTFLFFSMIISTRHFYNFNKQYISIINIQDLYAFFEKLYNYNYSLHSKKNPLLKEETVDAPPVTDTSTILPLPKKKYEDKYIHEVRKEKKEYVFTDEEKIELGNLFCMKKTSIVSMYEERIDELKKNLHILKKQINDLEKMTNEDFETLFYEEDEFSKEECINNKHEMWKAIEKELVELEHKVDDNEMIEKESFSYATTTVIEQKTEKLNNCFVMEYTPLGNVLMTYNSKRTSFSYYSDFTVPYRYLEVVARKFVKTFHCRPLFIDMGEELQNMENKKKEELKQETILFEKNKNASSNANNDNKDKYKEKEKEKKNVFAKLKNYNKVSGKVNTAPPPKSSIPNNVVNSEKTENILLKENANRYTYEGKISTFQMIKKVERKVVDKKYGMSFADFKKLQIKK